MKKILTLLLLLISVFAQAQSIKGTVSMEKDKSPAQFVSVGLAQLPDSTLITSVITLTDGVYIFEKVKPGNYNIKVSYLGYKADQKNVTIMEGSGEIVIDTIYLSESTTTLNEATVLGERLKGKELVDRTIYSIPPLVAKSSTNGYEILKKIPQVNVDFQNNVTLNGSSNFIIQVDGRQRDKEFLAKLLPSDIESVEIISNPSGKYEGNVDGVINIILKKEARYGMNGNISLAVKPFNKPTTSLSGSLDYSLGKITFYATAYTFTQNLYINSTNESNFFNDSTSRISSGGGTIKVSVSSINTGFDYYINDKNNLSFNVSYKPIIQNIDMHDEAVLDKQDIPLTNTLTSTSNDLRSDESTFSLFYKKSFKKPVQEFTADATYYFFKSNQENDFTNNIFNIGSGTFIDPISRFEDDINQRNYFSLKLNYVHPIGLSTKIETGYQAYYQYMDYDMKVNNIESDIPFKYKELRNSVYAGITMNLKKIGFQATLRAENSNINADSVTSPDYTCFLPSVNVQYKFSSAHNLKWTYNRRINRPGIYDMNPNYKIDQYYNETQGNPNLRPDYRDRFQLTYTWNFGSNYFSPNIYYELLSDKVGRGNIIRKLTDSTSYIFTKPFNLLSGYEYGGGFTAMLWFININARIFSGHFNEYVDQSFKLDAKNYFSYSVSANAFAPLDKDKKTVLFAFINYNGVNIDAQTKTYNMTLYGFGGQKQFKKNSLGVVFVLPFSKKIDYSRSETETPYSKVKTITGFDVSYYIQFFYSYKFNKGKNVKKLDKKLDIESDSKSQGIGK